MRTVGELWARRDDLQRRVAIVERLKEGLEQELELLEGDEKDATMQVLVDLDQHIVGRFVAEIEKIEQMEVFDEKGEGHGGRAQKAPRAKSRKKRSC